MSVATRYTGQCLRARILAGDEPQWLLEHPRSEYVRQCYLARLPWVDREELKWLDFCRRAWSVATGREHVLDHVVPLTHPAVCGLTVPWNFRLVPHEVNASRGNDWFEHQMEMAL